MPLYSGRAYRPKNRLRVPLRPARTIRPFQRITQFSPNVQAPKPAAPRPAAPAPAPGPQPLPFDGNYENQVAGLNRQRDLNQAGLQYDEQRVRRSYGFDDPSDPFSAAKMLQRSWQQGQQGRLNSAGNNLYSSSFQRNEDQARFGHEQRVDTSRKSYADALQSLKQRRAQSQLDYDTGLNQANADRIGRVDRPEDPGEYAAAAPAAPLSTAMRELGPRGAVRAQGIGGGRWKVRFKDGRLVTMQRRSDGRWVVVRGR